MRRPLPLARRTGDLGWGGGDRSIFPDGERIASDQGRSSRAGWLLSDACRYGFILRARDGMLRMTAGPPNSPWRFLDHPPAFLFFTGKGGVGKTALEIDPQTAARAYRDRIVGPVRGVLPDANWTAIDLGDFRK
jgi:hypothetical protein